MRLSTFCYCMKQGIINIRRNILFTLASTATISACIFLFCLFFAIIMNIQNVVTTAESTVGITVFFNEELTQSDIDKIGEQIKARPEVKSISFTSAEQAWDSFKVDYFAGYEEFADDFANDNPLANCSYYEIFLKDIRKQDAIVSFLENMDGVRRVRYSSSVVTALSNFNRLIGILSVAIIGVLLAVAVFLISNTISVAAAFRKNETQIMRLIGATNYMIRAPFVAEGVIIGLIGAAIPLTGIFYIYKNAVVYMEQNFMGLSGLFQFLPIGRLFPSMLAVSLGLGVGIGFLGSFFTVRKYLKV